MNKAEALHSFWSSFDLPAYDEYTVPDKPSFPYITYEVSEGELDYPVVTSGSLWYQGTSWSGAENKADEIARKIRKMNAIRLDNGFLAITAGSPFAQRMDDPNDDRIRRMLINITAEYFTEY